MSKVILFLDIDGVLHHSAANYGEEFCCKKYLWKILDNEPSIDVVISSDWRLTYSLEKLKDLITSDGGELYKERIIGVTPSIKGARHEYGGREKECCEWLELNNNMNSEWIALDDIAGNFKYGNKRLFLINHEIGLSDSDVDKVLEYIQSIIESGSC